MQKILLFMVVLMMALALFSCDKGKTEPNFKFLDPNESGVVAEIAGEKISNGELMEGIEGDVYDAERKVFEIKFNRLKALVLKKLMEADPRKKGLTNDEYLEKYISSSVKVSDKEIDKFIEERHIPAMQVNDALKGKVRQFLEMEKKRDAIDEWVAKKTQKNPVKVYLQKPVRPTFDVKVGNAPVKGSKDAKVMIVEFSDFQCPYCAKAVPIINELKKKYGSKIAVSFKHFPLPFHQNAEIAAIASMCVYQQNNSKFWDMHDKLFGNQGKLQVDGLKELAKEVGVDMAKFENCLTNKATLSIIKSDMQEGKNIGVKSTPTFYINGKLVNGAQPIQVFSEIIDEELSK